MWDPQREKDSQSSLHQKDRNSPSESEGRVVSPLSESQHMGANLIPYSSQSFKNFYRAETSEMIQIMFLSVVFFGNHSAVDIDVQTRTQPCLRELYMGDCCSGKHTLLLWPPFHSPNWKTFFYSHTWPPKCQVQGYHFKSDLFWTTYTQMLFDRSLSFHWRWGLQHGVAEIGSPLAAPVQ